MKKYLLIFINFIIVFNLAGCSKKMESSSPKSDFEMKSAQIITDNYIRYIARKDENNAKILLGKGLEKSVYFDNNIDIWGYKFDEISQVGNTGMITVFILKGSENKSYSLLEKYNFKIEKLKGEYKITEIKKKSEKELIVDRDDLRIKEKDQLESKLILDKDSIPKYISSKDNKSNTYNMQVSSTNYGPLAIAYSGEKAVFSTEYLGNCYFGLVHIDISMEASGAANEKKDEEKKSEGKSEKIEEFVGKKLINLDYLLNSKITNISFSPDEKFVIVGYMKSKGSTIRIYYSSSGELIPFKFEDSFTQDKYNVKFSGCDKNTFIFLFQL